MPILWRAWVAFTAIIALFHAILSVLAVLQHNALLSQLITQQVQVVVESTASSFRSVVDLGLPISTVRNASEILRHGQQWKPGISAIHVFLPTGKISASSAEGHPDTVPRDVLLAQSIRKTGDWSVETADGFLSGVTIPDASGEPVAGIVAAFPKGDFIAKTNAVVWRLAYAAVGLFVVFSAAAFVVLRIRLADAFRGLSRLDEIVAALSRDRAGKAWVPVRSVPEIAKPGYFGEQIKVLEADLDRATHHYEAACTSLAPFAHEMASGQTARSAPAQRSSKVITALPETSMARILTRQLLPWAALLVLGSALALGTWTYWTVVDSLTPELAERRQLIGTVANANIQRAISAGVPLESLVGAEEYFGELLRRFPEIGYFGISTGRIIFEAGSRDIGILSHHRTRKNGPAYPILANGKQVGYVIVEANPNFLLGAFRQVLFDLAVVTLVVILLSFQITSVLISRSLTAPFNRLMHLAALQAAGDFSQRIVASGRGTLEQLGTLLSARAERLHELYLRSCLTPGKRAGDEQIVADTGARFHIDHGRPRVMQFSYLNDIRLPLFLFAAADELPLSFFPLFTRSAENSLPWLDTGVVISLPLAGYLIAIMIGSPYARPLSDKLGHRNLLLLAMAPPLVGHIGLALSANVLEIILFRTLIGFGYAIATLVFQDYVLDVLPKEQRARSLGFVTAALFGGIFAGTALGGILADRLGAGAVFYVSAGLVLASAILTLRLVPSGLRMRIAEPVRQPAAIAVAAIFRNSRFIVLLAGIAIPANVLLQAFISYLVALQLNAFDVTASGVARTLMLYFLLVALVGPLAGRIDRRLDPAVVALIGAALSGTGLLAAAVWPTTWMIVLAVFASGVGHGMVRGPQVAVAMNIAESELADIGPNAVLGALRTVERAGSVVGLIAIALLSSRIGYAGAIGAMAAWVLGGAALAAIFHSASGGFAALRSRPA
jgi:predicted MFS family arabinose efflux permease